MKVLNFCVLYVFEENNGGLNAPDALLSILLNL